MNRNSIRKSAARALLAALFTLMGTHAHAQTVQFYKADINNPVESSVAVNPDGSFEVVAGGNDTWDNSDSFTFLHQKVTGDFDVRVRVVSLEVDSTAEQDYAKASIMARANDSAGSPNVQVNALPPTGANIFEAIYRPAQDGGTDDLPDRPTPNYGDTPGYPNAWLRMRRVENQFTTFFSNDGFNWTTRSSVFVDPAQFPRTILVGLSTVAHLGGGDNQDNRVRATYADFQFTSGAPAPTVDGLPAGDRAPGTFPDRSVTGVNWTMSVPGDGLGVNGSPLIYNGPNKNEVVIGVEGQGPIPWSAPGFNQGDMDVNFGVSDPVGALSNTGPYGPNYSTSVTSADAEPAQGWYPSIEMGMLFASIRKNSVQWNDGAPPFSAFAWNSVDGSSRRGFNMLHGNFRNQDGYLSFGKLGETAPLPPESSPAALREANIDSAMAWFPFAQGWKGGYVANPSVAANGAWIRHAAVSPALSNDIFDKNSAGAVVTWVDLGGFLGGLASVSLPGVNSLESGMLFTLSNHEGNDNRGAITAAAPKADGSGWLVAIRQDDDIYDPSDLQAEGRAQFQFMYVPFTAHKLVGGYVRGSTGVSIQKAGTYTLSRLAAGRYGLTIPGKTKSSGMLLLGNAGYISPDLPDDGALTYEYIDGQFIIEARHSEAGSPMDATPLRDTDFYFAWVDFQDPLSPSAPAPKEPSFAISAPVTLHAPDIGSREAGIAINTDENEALVVTIITDNSTLALDDPITGQLARHIMVGYFVDPTTFAVRRGPFAIVGNPGGNMENHSVQYNPVSKKYAVFTTGQTYGANSLQLVLGAMVNPQSVAGANDPVIKRFVVDPDTTLGYDDVGLAVSTQNGNMLLVAERNFVRTDTGANNEGAVGILFDKDGNRLTPDFTRLDVLGPDGDEDDPDVSYLPLHDTFFFQTNTDDPAGVPDRIVGFAIATTPDAGNGLAIKPAQQLADLRQLINQGHAIVIENPFNGELIGGVDYNSGPGGGDLFYLTVGADLSVTPTREQIPYIDTTVTPSNHRHPMMAVDPVHGVIALAHNMSGPFTGMGLTLLGPDGEILPGRPEATVVYPIAETAGPVDSGANFANLVYDPHSGSFISIYNRGVNGGVTASRITVFSNHLPEVVNVPPPSLSIVQVGGSVKISWPAAASAAGYRLQSTASLGAAFANVTATPVVEGSNDTVTVTASGTAYFRLSKP